jgi:hypothetical protein
LSKFQEGERGETGGGGGPRFLCAQTFVTGFAAGFAAEVENDRRKSLSGSWGDDKTVSPVLSKDLKQSKKSARWWRQLKATKMKKERV